MRNLNGVVGLFLFSKAEVETIYFEIIIRIEIDFQSKENEATSLPNQPFFCIDQVKTSLL